MSATRGGVVELVPGDSGGSARAGGPSQMLAHPHSSSRSSREHERVRGFIDLALSGQHVPGRTCDTHRVYVLCPISRVTHSFFGTPRSEEERCGAVSYPRYRTLQPNGDLGRAES